MKKALLTVLLVFLTPIVALAYDVNEKLSIEGTLTGVYQYGDFDIEGIKDTDRGAAVLDLGVNFHPTESDEFQVTLSYAAGNALNPIVPFSLAPYADDLEDDLKNINGRNRDYLLEAWYKHTFTFNKDTSLGITFGIIDSTGYLDDNAFANDEVAQFMNDIFVNSTLANLPSYDLGGVAELDISSFSLRGLAMSSKNEEGREYNYYALQLGYKMDTPMGEGNYRIYGFTTNKRFQNWDETDEESLQGFGISADQKLSEILGVFARLGWQDDKAAAVVHDAVYSGGLNINGKLWGRENDEIGLGYAYLNGADRAEIDDTNAFEAYAKFKISDFSDITFDVQYLNDNMKIGEDNKGVIYGIRLNAYF
ncbi:MAG: carbohydrate porin [Thermodesulfovibrionales bacterium]|nr:carbohydrate porin [Thermodesulfovibrionales bacterium]